MPLVDAKCTNCGAPLKVDSGKDAAICRYCGSAFIVEKAIQNYYFSGNITNNINADVVNVMGQSEFVIRAGELEEYHGESMDVVVPAQVKSIKSGAFSGCKNLNSVQLPEGLREIDERAFYNCKYLTSVNIPSTVVSIGNYAFAGCRSLKSVTLPNGLKEIGYSAFSCSGLTSITLPSGLQQLGSEAFSVCIDLTSVTIPNGIEVLRSYTFKNCTNLVSVNIPSSVTTIENGAFDGCSNLKSLIIPDGVTFLGTFSDCINLSSLHIPDSVTNLNKWDTDYGGGHFWNCKNLKDIRVSILPNRVFHPLCFWGTPFYEVYQKKLREHGYCPVCSAKLTGLLFKSCPRNCNY